MIIPLSSDLTNTSLTFDVMIIGTFEKRRLEGRIPLLVAPKGKDHFPTTNSVFPERRG